MYLFCYLKSNNFRMVFGSYYVIFRGYDFNFYIFYEFEVYFNLVLI